MEKGISAENLLEFRQKIYSYYRVFGRNFPWRETRDPYEILVSELMLQQTQTSRVLKKYDLFLETYPDVASLAEAELTELLKLWKGLGYTRRALGLREIARILTSSYEGKVPEDSAILETFPMIGPATSCSIVTFAFNIPTVFIEVNIRRVFLLEYFDQRERVSDKEILPYIEISLDTVNPREWYYALMDYGAMLKKAFPALSKQSRHYTKQKPFEGSKRQLRGRIIAFATEHQDFSLEDLYSSVPSAQEEVLEVAEDLVKEGILKRSRDKYNVNN